MKRKIGGIVLLCASFALWMLGGYDVLRVVREHPNTTGTIIPIECIVAVILLVPAYKLLHREAKNGNR